jgi:hypothetical protein
MVMDVALFGGSGQIDVPTTTDELATLVASFETAHREEETH